MDDIIFNLYVNRKFSLRMIAEKIRKDHHFVKRRLESMGVIITTHDRIKRVFTDEHRKKISDSWKNRIDNGYIPYNLGKKMDRISILKNMRNHLKYDVSLEWLGSFDDIEKLKFLNRSLSRKRDCISFDTDMYKNFIDKFYYDKKFNELYNKWIKTKDKWIKPSLDHIIPKSNGGSLSIENMRFVSWLENRTKSDMSIEEWDKIKQNINYYF